MFQWRQFGVLLCGRLALVLRTVGVFFFFFALLILDLLDPFRHYGFVDFLS